MATHVVVTGIGLRSALGNLSQTWQGILAQQSGLRLAQPFPELPPRPIGLIHSAPQTDLNGLIQTLVEAALLNAQIEIPLPNFGLNFGVVVGSSRHHQNRWERFAQSISQQRSISQQQATFQQQSDRNPIPLSDWMDLWPGSSAIAIARLLKSTGPVLSPMAACATGLWAIAQGFELIQMGYCQQVVVVAAETPITPLVLTGFEQAGILAHTGVYPFDRDREGLAIAEGGAAFVLETLESAQSRQVAPYGKILGFGLATDAHHMSTPDPQGKGARGAIQTCLKQSGLSAKAIGYIHTHGTGTHWNDLAEANLISSSFSHQPYCSSTKGSTGHTLGASGALGVALTLMALEQQILPPNVGLRSPAFSVSLVTTPQSYNLKHALCLSFGFGGQNAAIALEHIAPETSIK